MSTLATKLFRLLINEATSDGERRNAAGALRSHMESEGISIEAIQWKGLVTYQQPPAPPPQEDYSWGGFFACRTMPFGKHKGAHFNEIPSDYLLWIIQQANMDSWIKGAAKYTLHQRGEI